MSVINWIRGGIRMFYGAFRIEELLTIALSMTLVIALLALFHKPLRRVVSARALTGVFGSALLLTILTSPQLWDALRLDYLPHIRPILHIPIPSRIESQFVEIPSLGPVDVRKIAFIVYWVGLFAVGDIRGRSNRKLRKLIRKNAQPCPPELFGVFRPLLEEYPIKLPLFDELMDHNIALIVVPGLKSPCTISLKEPTIALGRTDYSPEQLQWILRHELAHISAGHLGAIARLDLLCDLFWFNPFVHIYAKLVRRDMEFAVDEMLISPPKTTKADRICYARLLTDLAETRSLSGIALYFTAGAELIQQRVAAILRPSRKAASWLIAIAVLILSLHSQLLFSVGATGEELFPTESAILACLGNDRARLEDAFPVLRRSFSLNGMDYTLSGSASKISAIYADGEAFSESEMRALLDMGEQWIQATTALLGEPFAETHTEALASFKLNESSLPSFSASWRVTPLEKDSPPQVLTLSLKYSYHKNLRDAFSDEQIPELWSARLEIHLEDT